MPITSEMCAGAPDLLAAGVGGKVVWRCDGGCAAVGVAVNVADVSGVAVAV